MVLETFTKVSSKYKEKVSSKTADNMNEKPEEEKMLQLAALRRLRSMQLLDWEKDFVRNAENQMQRGNLTEKQKIWLNRLKEKYLR